MDKTDSANSEVNLFSFAVGIKYIQERRSHVSDGQSYVHLTRHSSNIPLFAAPPPLFFSPLLKGRVGILEQHLKVGLVPGTGLGRGLEGVGQAAEGVVAGGRRVAGAVRLASGLAPDKGVGELEARRRRGADAEAGAVDVAPVTPGVAEADDSVAVF